MTPSDIYVEDLVVYVGIDFFDHSKVKISSVAKTLFSWEQELVLGNMRLDKGEISFYSMVGRRTNWRTGETEVVKHAYKALPLRYKIILNERAKQ